MFRIQCTLLEAYLTENDHDLWSTDKEGAMMFETCLDAERYIKDFSLADVDVV